MSAAKNPLNCLVAIVASLVLLAIASLSFLSTRYGWRIYLELFSHFQLQYLLLCVVLFGLLVLTRRFALSIAGFLCILVVAVQVVPWYIPQSDRPLTAGTEIEIFLANVNAKNTHYDRLLAQVRQVQPDLAIIQEAEGEWLVQLRSLGDILPYAFTKVGTAVYSKQPLANADINFIGTDRGLAFPQGLNAGDRALSLVTIHPLPPILPAWFQQRNQQLDLTGTYIQSLSEPIILAGDFNSSMWSPYYRRLVDRTGLKNVRRGFGILPSWPTAGTYSFLPSFGSLLFSTAIDHVLVSPEIRVLSVRTRGNNGSDHRPVIVKLQIPN